MLGFILYSVQRRLVLILAYFSVEYFAKDDKNLMEIMTASSFQIHLHTLHSLQMNDNDPEQWFSSPPYSMPGV